MNSATEQPWILDRCEKRVTLRTITAMFTRSSHGFEASKKRKGLRWCHADGHASTTNPAKSGASGVTARTIVLRVYLEAAGARARVCRGSKAAARHRCGCYALCDAVLCSMLCYATLRYDMLCYGAAAPRARLHDFAHRRLRAVPPPDEFVVADARVEREASEHHVVR